MKGEAESLVAKRLDYIAELKEAGRRLHDCDSECVETVMLFLSLTSANAIWNVRGLRSSHSITAF